MDYYFRKGLPYPTGFDGEPMNLEIIAMCPATFDERDISGGRESLSAVHFVKCKYTLIHAEAGSLSVQWLTGCSAEAIELGQEGFELSEHLQDREYGAGMVASFTKEKDEVFQNRIMSARMLPSGCLHPSSD
ncbi:hypothetical protein BDV12DRAFT_171766 [Aspergillus spectabilis]